ncbi:Oidioi.mRNA.OKI2018_I69.PAR.g9512.t1.cds [Oikopleura dioica]|uniref:Oidioi.mRNA.OKI2018_I69.PAR.g9512.t1.cds n=1 Tax=Oikopleura dioica TaxID=34765 RepID=A0ABN7RL77_OIKDI|nr:Oidioi.mRNA.OKI2018_I69.PAR.g9512.t1.cds [Oikopleura dioica]
MICLKSCAIGWSLVHFLGLLIHGCLIIKFLSFKDNNRMDKCSESRNLLEIRLSDMQNENFFALNFHTKLCNELSQILPTWSESGNFSSTSLQIMGDFRAENCTQKSLENITDVLKDNGALVASEFSKMYNYALSNIELNKQSFEQQELRLTGEDLAELVFRQSRAVFIELENAKINCRFDWTPMLVFLHILGMKKLPEEIISSTTFDFVSFCFRMLNYFTLFNFTLSMAKIYEYFRQKITTKFKMSRRSFDLLFFIVILSVCVLLPALIQVSRRSLGFLPALMSLFDFPGDSVNPKLEDQAALSCLGEILHPIHDDYTLEAIYENCFDDSNQSSEISFFDVFVKFLLQIYVVNLGAFIISRKKNDGDDKKGFSRDNSQVNSEFTRRSSLNDFSRGTSLI